MEILGQKWSNHTDKQRHHEFIMKVRQMKSVCSECVYIPVTIVVSELTVVVGSEMQIQTLNLYRLQNASK